MKKKRNFFARNYLKCWKFGVDSKWFFVAAFGIFALTFLVGFAYPVFFRTEIFELIRSLILELEGASTFELIWFIFLNNLRASFFAMVLGIFLGVMPILTSVVNGYLLGFVAREAVMVEGLGSLWRIFPHGVFELPAVLFSIGIGLRLGSQVVRRGMGRLGEAEEGKGVGYVFREALRFFVFVVFPLLALAAVIEGVLIGLAG